MATKSIYKSVEIRNEKGAAVFLDAIESSRRAQDKIKEPNVHAKRLKGKELKDFIGKVIK